MSDERVELDSLPWFIWVLLALALLTQGTWLFLDARKRGAYPWFWGIWGLTTVPLPTILYLLYIRFIYRRGK